MKVDGGLEGRGREEVAGVCEEGVALGLEIRASVLEVEESRVGAAATKSGGDGGDVVEVLELLGENQGEVRLLVEIRRWMAWEAKV